MTRLSDSLHGAADRAPIGDVTVSVETASRRVRRQRVARGAGNVAAGVGALALVVGGVFAPGFAAHDTAAKDDASLTAPMAPEPEFNQGGVGKEGIASADAARIADWGYCGSYPLDEWGNGDGTFSLDVGWKGADPVDGGTTLKVPVTTTANTVVNVTTGGPVAVVLWDGMVVARIDSPDAVDQLTLAAGESVDGKVAIPMVSCFDETPLPASKYQLVVSQAFDPVVTEETPTTEPLPELSVEPSLEPEPVPGNVGDTAMEPSGPMPVEPWYGGMRTVADPINFSIAGDPVKDPFADYVPKPWTPPAKPDSILTPQLASDMFKAHATTDAWDFAAGTSRYVYRAGDNGNSDTDWQKTFFGCSWDGNDIGFPRRSADLGLLDFSYSGPSRVGISYGWVVDGNPEVGITVKNTSDYALPGFYGQPSRTFYLVQNGKVVAEVYPSDIDRNGGDVMYEKGAAGISPSDTARVDAPTASMIAPDTTEDYWGVLDPGKSLSGKYLWREVNGCWTDSGQSDVPAGNYQLVVTQTIYVDSGDNSYGGGVIMYDAPSARESGGDSATGGEDAPPKVGIPAPAPDKGNYQWGELQVWYSVGTVTVTT